MTPELLTPLLTYAVPVIVTAIYHFFIRPAPSSSPASPAVPALPPATPAIPPAHPILAGLVAKIEKIGQDAMHSALEKLAATMTMPQASAQNVTRVP